MNLEREEDKLMSQLPNNDSRNRILNLGLPTALGVGSGLAVGEATHNLALGSVTVVAVYIATWFTLDRMRKLRKSKE